MQSRKDDDDAVRLSAPWCPGYASCGRRQTRFNAISSRVRRHASRRERCGDDGRALPFGAKVMQFRLAAVRHTRTTIFHLARPLRMALRHCVDDPFSPYNMIWEFPCAAVPTPRTGEGRPATS